MGKLCIMLRCSLTSRYLIADGRGRRTCLRGFRCGFPPIRRLPKLSEPRRTSVVADRIFESSTIESSTACTFDAASYTIVADFYHRFRADGKT